MIARIRSFGARRIAVVVLATGLVSAVAVPTILATTAPPTARPALVADVGALARPGGLGRIVRGDATLLKKDGTTMTVHFERGDITAASASSVTVKSADGVSTTFAIGSDTRVRSQGKAIEAGSLKTGDHVLAVGTASGSRLRRAPHSHSGAPADTLTPASRAGRGPGSRGAVPEQAEPAALIAGSATSRARLASEEDPVEDADVIPGVVQARRRSGGVGCGVRGAG